MTGSLDERVRVQRVRTLSDQHGTLRSTDLDYRRGDGSWQPQTRETYDRGNGAVILPFDPVRGTVLLVRQFRYPAYANGHRQPLIEAIAGVLEEQDPASAIIKEAKEEAGLIVSAPQHVFDAFMSPGAMTEKLSFFISPYSLADRTHAGGGLAHEGEDIEVLEPAFDDALAMTRDGRIVDAKTILLLQHVRLAGLL